jgi:hypothetical protein
LNAIRDGKVEFNLGAWDCEIDLVVPVIIEIFYHLASEIEPKLIQMADHPRGFQAQGLVEAEIRDFVRLRQV